MKFNVVSTSLKLLVDGRLLLRLLDVVGVVREQHALQALVLSGACGLVFRAVVMLSLIHT